MKMNKNWLVMLNAVIIMTVAHAATGAEPDPAKELEKAIPPQEMEKIKKEAEKIKEGKQPQAAEQTQQTEQQPLSTEKLTEKKEEAERSIRRRQTMHQGFYPSKEITQKPKDILTEGPIRSLDGSKNP